MTTETKQQNETRNRPDYVVKQRNGYGKKATYERLGVAWQNEDGSFYVKLHGKQIIEGGFTLYPLDDSESANS